MWSSRKSGFSAESGAAERKRGKNIPQPRRSFPDGLIYCSFREIQIMLTSFSSGKPVEKQAALRPVFQERACICSRKRRFLDPVFEKSSRFDIIPLSGQSGQTPEKLQAEAAAAVFPGGRFMKKTRIGAACAAALLAGFCSGCWSTTISAIWTKQPRNSKIPEHSGSLRPPA